MFAVIFEVKPKAERMDAYLAIAGTLRPALEKTAGFLSNERFQSRRRPGWLLSLSLWQDEKSLIRWRTDGDHHGAQTAGRVGIFADYHLRVGEVAADSGLPAGEALVAPRRDLTEAGGATRLVLIERQFPGTGLPPADPAALAAALGAPALDRLGEWDVLESIVMPGKFLVLAAGEMTAAVGGDAAACRREVRIIRDYGMFDRREAPQYYPAAARGIES